MLALPEPIKHFSPPAMLRIVWVDDLEPITRRLGVRTSGCLNHDSLNILGAATRKKLNASASEVVGIEDARMAAHKLPQLGNNVRFLQA